MEKNQETSQTPTVQTSNSAAESTTSATSVYDFKMKDIDGKDVDLSIYKGKVLVLVNVASECGYTKQYKEIEAFYKQNQDKGIIVLGFPANNFGGQEPGTDAEIKQFCSSKFSVTFPMFSKISVKGSDIHPLYQYLTNSLHQDISWNFNKILVNKNGIPVSIFKSGTKVTDEEFTREINALVK